MALAFAAALAVFPAFAWAQAAGASLAAAQPVSAAPLSGVAIGGADTVAYHARRALTEHRTTTGSATHTVEYLGAQWRFASQESADRFAANPERYVPQYNGHCSNALALGEGLIRTDGSVWEFFGDSLHLFYAERGRQRWINGDWQAYKQEADGAWQSILAARTGSQTPSR